MHAVQQEKSNNVQFDILHGNQKQEKQNLQDKDKTNLQWYLICIFIRKNTFICHSYMEKHIHYVRF